MKIAYSNNGKSWRHIGAEWNLLPGEVTFDHQATEQELCSAFPSREQSKINDARELMQCESWKVLRALTQMGLRQSVDGVVANADQDTKDMYYRATVFHRTSPWVAALATGLGKTDADIDSLFTLAMSIQS